MIKREEVFKYIKEKYEIAPDYPWRRTPNYAILRHKNNRKWFAAVIDITEDKIGLNSTKLIDAVLLKNDPLVIGSLRTENGIYAGYHMNKEHWITIHLESGIDCKRVFELIDMSFNLTKR
ncbi:MAG: MmcQ/YjbR family DNA-binding protein [Firmicutes bacterium]|nr:MmcQ/YjbR family DNA-binding protein [Bacillota bacterium]